MDEKEGDLAAKQRAGEFWGYVQRVHRRDQVAAANGCYASEN
ncbi:hypothetical protein [Labrenzia sp. THAF35]|nr:hypothetical protein [Labrenzia sp. THAF35]